MTTIWMDPTELDTVAASLNDQVSRLRGAVEGVRATCLCATPPALAGWLHDELAAVEREGTLAALTYSLAGLDIAVRSREISQDQSLATAVSEPDIFTTWLDPMDSGLTTATVGGPDTFTFWLDPMDSGPTTATVGGPDTFTFWLDPMEFGPSVATVGGSGPGFSAGGGGPGGLFTTATIGPIPLDPVSAVASMITSNLNDTLVKTWLAPEGTNYEGNGMYSDVYGNVGGFGSLYRDPATGGYTVL